ncbi:MAG: metallophosphoesterase family protein, partial [Draconibacterium sp.]|nr:metallophosphoesterase family protein [Draconibacterium sp.]
MRKRILLFVLVAFGLNYSFLYAQSLPEQTPEHVILNLTETPENSVAITWRTSEEMTQYVQWLEITDSPAVPNQNQSIKAKSETVTYTHSDLPITVTNHSAIISGLKANTSYIYRVGADLTWSEWYEFKTAGKEEDSFSFVYFGDAQNSIKSHWSRVIRKAYSFSPDAGFMVYAGDLINVTNSEKEWQEWFHAGDFIHATIPSIMTPGNHEYDSTALDNHWRSQFTLPLNGPDHPLLSEVCYFVDYNILRIISIDADIMTEAHETIELTKNWLES